MAFNFTLVAVASALLGSVASILARTLLKDLKSKDILGINFLTMGATLLIISPLFYSFEPSLTSFLLIVLIALIDTLANYFFFKTYEQTEVSVATPILSLAPVFTFAFGWLFLADTVQLSTYVLAFLILAGVVAFSADFKNFSRFRAHTLQPAILSSLLFGISAIPSKYLLSTLHAINAPTLYMFRAGLIALFALLFFNFALRSIEPRQYRLIFFRGLFVISQWVLLYFALSRGNAGVTVTLANITPIFVFVLSAIFLAEKPTMKKVIASILVLALSLII
ncbi:MAG: DMT family transporter [Candidatus Liptonbacteria bacterium]|nr:DMT family transporter [Candidatus Liptonbacteria bacterium]